MQFDTFSQLSLQAQSAQALTHGTLLAQRHWTEAQLRLYRVPTGPAYCFVEVGYTLPGQQLVSLRSFDDPTLLAASGWHIDLPVN